MSGSQETTVSYYRLPQNDNILVKIHDLHIQSLLKSIKLLTSFLLSFHLLGLALGVWIMAAETTNTLIIAAVGTFICLLGIIAGFFGLRAIYYQSRKSSSRFYLVLRLFSCVWLLYVLAVYILIGFNL